jgi:hypothetical protein
MHFSCGTERRRNLVSMTRKVGQLAMPRSAESCTLVIAQTVSVAGDVALFATFRDFSIDHHGLGRLQCLQRASSSNHHHLFNSVFIHEHTKTQRGSDLKSGSRIWQEPSLSFRAPEGFLFAVSPIVHGYIYPLGIGEKLLVPLNRLVYILSLRSKECQMFL